jgi:hypothetical protein
MRRIDYAGILVVLLSGCLPAGAEIGGMPGGAIAIGEDMVPDPAYQPRVGDRSILYAIEDGRTLDRLPLLKDVTAYDIYVRSQQAHDNERLQELEEQGWLWWANPGTRITLLAIQDRSHTGARTVSQVRAVDDRFKNQLVWTPTEYIARLIHKEPE